MTITIDRYLLTHLPNAFHELLTSSQWPPSNPAYSRHRRLAFSVSFVLLFECPGPLIDHIMDTVLRLIDSLVSFARFFEAFADLEPRRYGLYPVTII